MICVSCRHEVDAKDKFCRNCGNPLNISEDNREANQAPLNISYEKRKDEVDLRRQPTKFSHRSIEESLVLSNLSEELIGHWRMRHIVLRDGSMISVDDIQKLTGPSITSPLKYWFRSGLLVLTKSSLFYYRTRDKISISEKVKCSCTLRMTDFSEIRLFTSKMGKFMFVGTNTEAALFLSKPKDVDSAYIALKKILQSGGTKWNFTL